MGLIRQLWVGLDETLCYAARWRVLYRGVDHRNKLFTAQLRAGGTITSEFKANYGEAQSVLDTMEKTMQKGQLQPCVYDTRAPATAYWSPETLQNRAVRHDVGV